MADPTRRLAFAIVALGVVLRIIFILFVDYRSGGGEAERIAVAIATGHGFADAYGVGTGPTAHLAPATPAVAGFVFWLFGPRTLLANAVLTGWSLACFVAAALLLERLFARLGAPPPARLAALAVMTFAPVFLVHEIIVFRYWEGQFAFVLLLAALLRIVTLRTAPPTLGSAVAPIVFNGVLLFVSPALGLAGTAAMVVAMIGRWPLPIIALSLAGCALIATPPIAAWALRNRATLGSPVLLRDNLGMELAFRNNDAVLAAGASHDVVDAQWRRIHPDGNGPGTAAMRRMGEHAYKAALQRQSFRWIAAHPLGFAALTARGWLEFFFPSPRNFSAGTALPRTAMIWSVDAIGLATLAWMGWRQRPGWLPVLAAVTVMSLFYAPFVYLWRYHYQSYNLLLFAAASAIWAGWRRFRRIDDVAA